MSQDGVLTKGEMEVSGGMNFDLSEEQQMVREMVQKFAAQEVAPLAAEMDRTGIFKKEILKKAAELNLLGVNTPPEYDGAGLDAVSYGIIIEELSRVDAATGTVISVQNTLSQHPFRAFGTEEQKKRFLPRLARGEIIGAYALTEPSSGSDAASLQTTAKKEGDYYLLNGTKAFVTNGAFADLLILYATVDKTKGHKGICCFAIERETPGLTLTKKEDMLGIRASGSSMYLLESCKVPAANMIGKEGEGFKIALNTLDYGRVSIGAQAVGIAQGALDHSIKYARERQQFGQPIANFQLVQEMLVEMATEVEAARFLVYRASYLNDRGARFTKEAAMAKLFASRTCMKATLNAVQIHGGYGYTKDYAVERMMRDAKVTEIYEGTSEVQKLVIARNIIGQE